MPSMEYHLYGTVINLCPTSSLSYPSRLTVKKSVLGIRIRLRIFLGLPDPDPLVRATDPSLYS
jgi:hypothetical protein